MNEQLHWTIEAICSDCQAVTTAPLQMGIVVHCEKCGARVQIDPVKTVFHRSSGAGSGAGYWSKR
ncbi:MAG TPA: hypothetical protein VGI39_45740 [Polyangiaceae bacterium]|jgi:DNA-directed RNA polymerase subunit RPC12/RpoP